MAPKKASKIAPKATAKSPMGNVKAAKKSPSAAFASFFTPLDDRVLVERSAVAERTAGGLYLPETVSASERPNQGRVVAVGSGHRDKKGRLHPLDVQLGDTVMYAGFSGSEVRINDQELLVLREKDIIAIVKL
jgi:chaperonin GroES